MDSRTATASTAPDGAASAPLELANLRESVTSRVGQAPLAFLSTLVSLLAFSPALVGTVASQQLVLWYVPVVLVLCWRVWLSVRVKRRLPLEEKELRYYDRELRVNSIVSQMLVGTGMWTVAPYGNEITPYFITLIIALFASGAVVSLVNDFRTVIISLPILFGQCILYWLMLGIDGVHVAIPAATIMMLMLFFARRTEDIHRQSIAIRFENDDLLKRLEEEKAIAVTRSLKRRRPTGRNPCSSPRRATTCASRCMRSPC
jgi:hypothetical protein